MIEVTDLHANIGGNEILRGINLSVETGKLITVVGANGAGKTTLLRTISGILPAKQGHILFNGKNIERTSPHQLARMGLVHVPQGRQIVPTLYVEENLLIGAQQIKAISREQLNVLRDREYERFPVLRDRAKILGGNISGGEQQMLAISRALMMEPKLLVLDEPSLGLAPKIVSLILNTLRDLANEGLSILLVEQVAKSALKVADYGYVMHGGCVVLEGKAADVLSDKSLLKGYLG